MFGRIFKSSSSLTKRERQSSSKVEPMTIDETGDSMGLCGSSELLVSEESSAMKLSTNPTKPGSPIAASCSKSVETPMTADMSWGGESSESTHVENMEDDEQPVEAALKSKRDQSKMERIKAKAIKSANKELGVDGKMLADALGLDASSGFEGKKSLKRGKGRSESEFSDPDDISQMRYLADSLGLPASFFGISTETAGEEPSSSSSKEEGLTHENLQEVPIMKDDSEAECNDSEGQTAMDSAVLESQMDSEIVPSIRKTEFKPNPTTIEEKRQSKIDALSRLNRMKAKAIKSATKSLGVNENHLSAAVGMSLEDNENTSSRTNEQAMSNEIYQESAEEIQFIADTLGLPVELFSRQSTKKDTQRDIKDSSAPTAQPQLGSLAAALGMKINRSAEVNVEEQKLTIAQERSNGHKEAASVSHDLESGAQQQPQAGSLAEALGMIVDDSEDAPPVRNVIYETSAKVPTLECIDKSTKSSSEEIIPAVPGSLASALGMNVSMPQGVSETNGESIVAEPQPGSLADALGMRVGPSLAVSQDQTITQPQPGSLADALGLIAGPTTSTTQYPEVAKPRAGSLADALGMSVCSSPPAPEEHDYTKIQSSNLADALLALGLNVGVPESVNQGQETAKPQPGSLADALGLNVGPSPSAPQESVVAKPRAGSLADALGMINVLPPKEPEITKPLAGSLADALGMNVLPPKEAEIAKPLAGSLADALGMNVRQSPTAIQEKSIPNPRPSRLADAFLALGLNVGSSESVSRGQEIAKVQPGSLADALGMSVNPSPSAAHEQEVTKTQPGGLVDTLGNGVRQLPTAPKDQRIAKPQAGSLADALGMNIRQSPPATREKEVTNPQPGSLADALGMSIGVPPAISQDKVVTRPQAGSLADALGMSVSTASSVSIPKQVQSRSVVQKVHPGSLAAALGMHVDIPIESPATVVSQPRQGSLAAALGMKVCGSDVVRTPIAQPQAGSLAAALGMRVDSSFSAPVVRQSTKNKTNTAAKIQPGSLAEGLRTTVAPSSQRSEKQNRSVSSGVVRGSLAAALGLNVESSLPTRTSTSQKLSTIANGKPRAGSLAEALGMKIESNSETPATTFDEECSDDYSGSEEDESDFDEEREESASPHDAARGLPKAGSLAAALGIMVEQDKASAKAERSVDSIVTSQGKNTLFGTVFSNVVAMQSRSSSSSNLKGQAKQSPISQTRKVQGGSLAEALGISVSAPQPEIMKPQPGSLAEALGMVTSNASVPVLQMKHPKPASVAASLGMSVSSLSPAKPAASVEEVPRALPTNTEQEEPSNESSKVYTMGPTSEMEVMLRVELASAKAEAAGAVAYGKALEKQIAQMAKAYVEKLAELQLQIASYQTEVSMKTREIETLESEVMEEQEAQDMLLHRLDQTTDRLTRTRALMDETDALLQQEFAEIRELRTAFEQRYYDGKSPTAEVVAAVSRSAPRTTHATRDIQMTLEREGDRRQSLKARLQAMRDAHQTTGKR